MRSRVCFELEVAGWRFWGQSRLHVLGEKLILLAGQNNLLEVLANPRNARQVYAVRCDGQQLVHHCLVSVHDAGVVHSDEDVVNDDESMCRRVEWERVCGVRMVRTSIGSAAASPDHPGGR